MVFFPFFNFNDRKYVKGEPVNPGATFSLRIYYDDDDEPIKKFGAVKRYMKKILTMLSEKNHIKMFLNSRTLMAKPFGDEDEETGHFCHFRSEMESVINADDMGEAIRGLIDQVDDEIQTYEGVGSGFTTEHTEYISMEIVFVH